MFCSLSLLSISALNKADEFLSATIESCSIRYLHVFNILFSDIYKKMFLFIFEGEDRRIRLWDLSSGELLKELKGHNDTINCLEFNYDGSILCSGILNTTTCMFIKVP